MSSILESNSNNDSNILEEKTNDALKVNVKQTDIAIDSGVCGQKEQASFIELLQKFETKVPSETLPNNNSQYWMKMDEKLSETEIAGKDIVNGKIVSQCVANNDSHNDKSKGSPSSKLGVMFKKIRHDKCTGNIADEADINELKEKNLFANKKQRKTSKSLKNDTDTKAVSKNTSKPSKNNKTCKTDVKNKKSLQNHSTKTSKKFSKSSANDATNLESSLPMSQKLSRKLRSAKNQSILKENSTQLAGDIINEKTNCSSDNDTDFENSRNTKASSTKSAKIVTTRQRKRKYDASDETVENECVDKQRQKRQKKNNSQSEENGYFNSKKDVVKQQKVIDDISSSLRKEKSSNESRVPRKCTTNIKYVDDNDDDESVSKKRKTKAKKESKK